MSASPLTCAELEPRLVLLADEGLDASERRPAEVHLEGCAECRYRAEEARSRIRLLRSVERRPVPVELDRVVFEEIRSLGSPATARERFAARWLARLPRLVAPPVLWERVLGEVERSRPRRGALLRFGSAAAAVAAALALVWFLASPATSSKRAFFVKDVEFADLDPIAARFADDLSGGSLRMARGAEGR